MVIPKNAAEENIFTQANNRALEEREKIFRQELKVHRYFMWLAVLFCMACFFVCWFSLSAIKELRNDIGFYTRHEMLLSERRDEREEIKAKQENAKAKRDSIAWVRHIKQMDRYDALPDYKNEGK